MLTQKQISEIDEMSNKLLKLQRDIEDLTETDSEYASGIAQLIHAAWNTLDAIATIELLLPF